MPFSGLGGSIGYAGWIPKMVPDGPRVNGPLFSGRRVRNEIKKFKGLEKGSSHFHYSSSSWKAGR